MSEPSPGGSGDGTPFLPENWNELAPLLDQLLDSPKEQRPALLAALSGGNGARQRALEKLLDECEADALLLSEPALLRFSELAKEPQEIKPPELLAERYRVGRELGRGGMATVYLGHDLKHGRDVAIKIIRHDLSASLGKERFLREIEIAARLRHPNIVPLYDSGQADGMLFFVMPYEEGQSLRDRIRRDGALPVADAWNVLRDVARALAYAHEHGVVHRDVKPDNVILSGGAGLVTDFGIAKAVSVALTDAHDATLTQAGTVIGTPAYMAPEQATGDASIDHRADIYSFGCLGYELFAGVPPFEHQTAHLVIAAHIAAVPRPIAELRADVPPPVAELLTRCLAKDPADRVQTARALLTALDGGLVATAPTAPAAGRRRRVRAWTAGAMLAALVTVAAYFATATPLASVPITVAVLPFANIAGDTAMDFVSDGLADEVASALTRVPGVQVKSRSGARAYRGQLVPDVTEAGAKLKADYVVTAVVRQDRGRWIVSAALERAADATSLWGEDFHVGINEQAAAADAIADGLTSALRRRFPRAVGVAPVRLSSEQTTDPDAYRLYVAGQGKLNRRGQSVTESAALFRKAIQRDSLFAPAYSGLSMALGLAPYFHETAATEVHDEVVSAARRALALDSTLSAPHVALGLAYQLAYEWSKAAAEYQTAIRRDSRSVEARIQYGRHLLFCGRPVEALVQLRAARSEDPASAPVLSWMSYAYFLNGQQDSALAEIGRALETDSTNVTSIFLGASMFLWTNRLNEARPLVARTPQWSSTWPYLAAKTGDIESARRSLREIDAKRSLGWGDLGTRAFAHLGLDDTASALPALERAADAKDDWPSSVSVIDPSFDAVRKSTRFHQLMRRAGLTECLPAGTI